MFCRLYKATCKKQLPIIEVMPYRRKNFGNTHDQSAYASVVKMRIVSETYDYNELVVDHNAYHKLGNLINVNSIKTAYLAPPLDAAFNRGIKRSVDILISIVMIVAVLSWLIPLLAILIKLDSKGPVFFRQKRNKRDGELFNCLKFRSMIVNTDADILPASKHDKRITRIGKFLRNHYLDELPQFFNVLLGDMSVVGPRPHMVSDNMKYEEQVNYYFYRHKVKPGITGLAQVMGYVGSADSTQKMQERVSMDIFYLRHWSFRLDIMILFRTIGKAFGS